MHFKTERRAHHYEEEFWINKTKGTTNQSTIELDSTWEIQRPHH